MENLITTLLEKRIPIQVFDLQSEVWIIESTTGGRVHLWENVASTDSNCSDILREAISDFNKGKAGSS